MKTLKTIIYFQLTALIISGLFLISKKYQFSSLIREETILWLGILSAVFAVILMGFLIAIMIVTDKNKTTDPWS